MATFTILTQVSSWNYDTHSKDFHGTELIGVFESFEDARKAIHILSRKFYESKVTEVMTNMPEDFKKELKAEPALGYGVLPEYSQKFNCQMATASVIYYQKEVNDIIFTKDFEVREILSTF